MAFHIINSSRKLYRFSLYARLGGVKMSQALPLAFIGMPGGLEWIVIGLVALLIFGKRLPGVARSLGQALHEFKSGISGQSEEKKEAENTVAKSESKTDGDAS